MRDNGIESEGVEKKAAMKPLTRNPVTILKDWLDNSRLQPENRIPPERELAEQLLLSRSALRKGLSALEAEGRIWRHVGKGTFIGSGPENDIPYFPSVNALVNPAEIMEARLVLEPRLAALAALKLTINDISQMEGYLRNSREARSTAEYENWDSLLHSAIAKASKNPLLYSMFLLVNKTRQEDVWGRLKEASLTLERRELYCLQHEELVVALKDRDAQKAEKVMREHIEIVRKHLLNEE